MLENMSTLRALLVIDLPAERISSVEGGRSACCMVSICKRPTCWVDQNMKAQWPDSEKEQTSRVTRVVRSKLPRNKSAIPGLTVPLACSQASGSGTSLRIHKTSRAGMTPTRKTVRLG